MKWAAIIFLPLIVLSVRLVIDARHELEHGDVDSLGRAARAWLPLGPSHEAREQLAQRGRAGDRHAWSELRASILATRWLLTPDRALLDEANRALGTPWDVPEPSRVWSVLALVGLAAFVHGVARALAGAQRHALIGALGFLLFVTSLWLA